MTSARASSHTPSSKPNPSSSSDRPHRPFVIAVVRNRGYGLPMAGHRDNHGLFLTTEQVDGLRTAHGIAAGEEWSPMAGIDPQQRHAVEAVLEAAPFASQKERQCPVITPSPLVSVCSCAGGRAGGGAGAGVMLLLIVPLRLNGDAGSLLHTEEKLQVPPITWRPKKGEAVSTQVAFGHIMFELAKVRAPHVSPAHEAATASWPSALEET